MMLQYMDTIIAFAVIMLGVSLLITILTQMISALLGYRGTNLLWGLKTLLVTVEPQLENIAADTLAHDILEIPLISDSLFSKFKKIPLIDKLAKRWRLASTITAEELASSLKYLVETKKTDDKTAVLINTVLGMPDSEAMRKAQMIKKVLDGLGSQYTVQLDKAIQQLGATMQTSIGKIEAAFNVVMKRASQRFALQMRIWTIIFAILISFGAGLDSFDLFKQLWTNPVLRTNLAGQNEMLLKEASVILAGEKDTTQSATSSVAPQILTEAMERLKKEEGKSTAVLMEAPQFKNMNEAVGWLRANIKADNTTRDNLVNKYQVLVIDVLKKHADTIQQGLAKSEFRLQIPISWKAFKNLSIWGILITAAFLSLGAPFWFSALKTLSNLRPLAASTTKATPGSAQS